MVPACSIMEKALLGRLRLRCSFRDGLIFPPGSADTTRGSSSAENDAERGEGYFFNPAFQFTTTFKGSA